MAAQARSMQPQATGFDAGIVRDKARIAQARALRERVLARDNESRPGHERFEEHSDHLVARDAKSGDVVGAYRILSPGDARRAGGYMAERDFDLALLVVLRERMVEIDRPCVDPRYPYASVMTHLWSALARYLIENRYDYVFGAASVTLRDGRTLNSEPTRDRGNPDNPLSDAELRDKYRSFAVPALGRERTAAIEMSVDALTTDATALRTLIEALLVPIDTTQRPRQANITVGATS